MDFMRIAKECARRSYQVRIYTMYWHGVHPPNFEIIRVPVSRYLRKNLYQDYARWVCQHLHEHTVDKFVGFNCLPKPHVYYAADGCYQQRLSDYRHKLYRYTPRARRFLRHERAICESQSHLLCLNQKCCDAFQKYYNVPEARLHLLPPAIRFAPLDDSRAYDETKKRARLRTINTLGLPISTHKDAKILLFIGSHATTKGLDRVVHALRALSRHAAKQSALPILWVVGRKPSYRYLWQIRLAGLEHQVCFIQPRNDLAPLMQAADLLVHLPRWEVSCQVLLEAMTQGLPVLTTVMPGYAHHVQIAQGGIVLPLPFSQTQCNAQLVAMINQPALLKEQGIRALEYTRTCDWNPAHATKKAVDIISA